MKRKIFLPLLVALAALFLAACGDGFGSGHFERYNDSAYTVGGGTVSEEITSLDIVWVSGKVIIVPSDGEEIVISEESELEGEDLILRYAVEKGTLKIKYAASRAELPPRGSKNLTVVLPADKQLNRIGVDTASSDVSVSGLTVKNGISVDIASGNVLLSAVRAKKIEVDSASADIQLHAVICTEIEVDTASGALEVLYSVFSKLDFDSASGNAFLSLPADSGFTCTFKTVSGRFSDDFGATKNKNTYTYGDGNVKITADTASGNLYIRKE